MTPSTSGTLHSPPITSQTTNVSEVEVSPTVRRRPLVAPRLLCGPADGLAPDDPDLRTYWVAALGAPAVADLLRLIAAARTAGTVPIPYTLPALLSERLVVWDAVGVGVLLPVPRSATTEVSRSRSAKALRLASAAVGTI